MNADEAIDKLARACSTREMCTSDARMLLKRWGIPEPDIPQVLAVVTAEKYIDDARFAHAFIRDKTRFDHWGLIKVDYMLRHKAIPDRIIREAHEVIDMEEYRDMIRHEIAKKKKTLRGKPSEIRVKLLRYGSSRGYETDILYSLLGESNTEE
jgi:regulatory protein